MESRKRIEVGRGRGDAFRKKKTKKKQIYNGCDGGCGCGVTYSQLTYRTTLTLHSLCWNFTNQLRH